MEIITQNYKRQIIRSVFILIFPTLFFILSFINISLTDLYKNLLLIVTSPSILLTDYIAVGGINATLFNVAVCGYISCFIIILYNIDIDGPFIAAVFTVMGFAFFGKNIYNIWSIFLGVFLFAKVQKVSFKNYLLVALFGTTLSPLVSFMTFAIDVELIYSVPLGIFLGVVAGFVLPSLASQMLKFHNGYNIYNLGFTGGIAGSFIIAVLKGFNYEFKTYYIISHEYNKFLFITLLSFFLFLIILGIILNFFLKEKSLASNLKRIYKSSGRLVSDFTLIGSFGAAVVNMGIMGIVALLFLTLINAKLSGPVVGGILTIVGFAAFGKHAFNCIPVMLGVYLASFVKIWGGNTDAIAITGLFATTLAPITGQYGILAGMLAGFFHLSIVMNVGVLHSGINLYNNGFAGGFVASFLVPIMNSLIKGKK